jgi:hypothetical protein
VHVQTAYRANWTAAASRARPAYLAEPVLPGQRERPAQLLVRVALVPPAKAASFGWSAAGRAVSALVPIRASAYFRLRCPSAIASAAAPSVFTTPGCWA